MNTPFTPRLGLRRLSTCAIALASIVGSFACVAGGNSTPAGMPPEGPPSPTPPMGPTGPNPAKATIRVVHASPDAPKVDVYAVGSSTPAITGLSYGDTSSYLELEPGTYSFALRVSPSTAADAPVYTSPSLQLVADTMVTAVAAGEAGSNDPASSLRVLTFDEAFRGARPNTAVVRVVHAGADAPAVDLDIGNDDPAMPEFTDLERFEDTGESGILLPSGSPLQIGVDAKGERVTAFTTPSLPEGANLFVIATGLLSKLPREADGFDLLAVGPAGSIGFIKQNPTVYALHASPNAPAVDLVAGNTKLVDDISFGGLSAPVQVPPGQYKIDVYPHGGSGTPAASGNVGPLQPGERYLAVATGFVGGTPAFTIDSYAEAFQLDGAASARLRAVHASPDAPTVDIGVVDARQLSPVLVPNLSFSQSSDGAGLDLAAGQFTLGVAPNGSDSNVVASFAIGTAPGVRAFGVAAGSLTSHGAPFQLLVVHTAASPWTVHAYAAQ